MKILYRWRRRGLQKLPAKLNKAGTLLCIEGLFLNYHATCLYLCHAQFDCPGEQDLASGISTHTGLVNNRASVTG